MLVSGSVFGREREEIGSQTLECLDVFFQGIGGRDVGPVYLPTDNPGTWEIPKNKLFSHVGTYGL